jgi:AcrR family transcriptional regulator
MVAGAMRLARTRLLAGEVEELGRLGGEVGEWCLSYADPSAAELPALDVQSVWHNTMLEPLAMPAGGADGAAWPSAGDKSLILASVAKLAAAEDSTKLTVSRICSTAGISRKKFDTYFEDAEACFLAALQQHAAEALAQAARAQAAARSWPGGVYRAIAALCEHIAGDAFLAGACVADDFAPDSSVSRARRRLGGAVVDQLTAAVPRDSRPSDLAVEASAGAVWGVFHHHLIRDWAMRRELSATLAYLALAPAIGAKAAVNAIAAEQSA